MKRSRSPAWGAITLLSLLLPVPGRSEDRTGEVIDTPPEFGEFIVVPLRIHLLQSQSIPEIDCRLTDADIHRILGKVNRIWHNAGVHFGLDTIVREEAASQERFHLLLQLGEGKVPLSLFAILRPEATRDFDGLHVYYIHEFSVNGVYLNHGYAFVKDSARLREVEGGIDEPIPRVTSHELGHALGLPHRQHRTNLLASGTTGTTLNQEEVRRARDRAAKIKGAIRASELRDRVRAESDPARTRQLQSWLEGIPGSELVKDAEEPR